jgi:Family of unknown function (DUF5906)
MSDTYSNSLRLQLFLNGYLILPCRGKVPVLQGWNAIDYRAKELEIRGGPAKRITSWQRRFPDALSTGIRIEGGLGAIDVDVNDAAAVDHVMQSIEEIAPDVALHAPTRYGGQSEKLALFVRIEGEDFVRIGSRKYHRPADPPKIYHHVEIFGGRPKDGKCSRQFACYGPRSYAEDGTVESEYVWAEGVPRLDEALVTDLPALTKVQAFAIIGAYEAWAEAQGWIRLKSSGEGESDGTDDVYDIDRVATRFELVGGDKVDYAELESLQLSRDDLRCSASFIPGEVTDTPDRCSVFWSPRYECAVVKDWKTGARHYPKDYAPADVEGLAEQLNETAAELGIELDEQIRGAKMGDFEAYLPAHQYVFMPARSFWPAVTIDDILPKVQRFNADGSAVLSTKNKPVWAKPSQWLSQHRPLEQMTWAPGERGIIRDRLVSDGGWIDRKGSRILNLYRGPAELPGEATMAGPWVEHVEALYGVDALHVIKWLAHRVQRPGEKINHALVLGGAPGIGKDTLLEPVKYAVGPWNVAEISPKRLMDKFNGFGRSVILRISEVKDLGEMTRYEFYDRTKVYCAAPPDVLEINEKNKGEYYIFNICGVVMTTNYKTDGIYLPRDDRRHYVAWSKLTEADLTPGQIPWLWDWYAAGGYGHVAAYLRELDISDFDAKASPHKTDAFYAIVDANAAPESNELSNLLTVLGNPDAVMLSDLQWAATDHEFRKWLTDRANLRRVVHRLEDCGYERIRDDTTSDGRWEIAGKRVNIYARAMLPTRDKMAAAEKVRKQYKDT